MSAISLNVLFLIKSKSVLHKLKKEYNLNLLNFALRQFKHLGFKEMLSHERRFISSQLDPIRNCKINGAFGIQYHPTAHALRSLERHRRFNGSDARSQIRYDNFLRDYRQAMSNGTLRGKTPEQIIHEYERKTRTPIGAVRRC